MSEEKTQQWRYGYGAGWFDAKNGRSHALRTESELLRRLVEKLSASAGDRGDTESVKALSGVDGLVAQAMAGREKARSQSIDWSDGKVAEIMERANTFAAPVRAQLALIESVRAWARAECGAAEADDVLTKLAVLDDVTEQARKRTQ